MNVAEERLSPEAGRYAGAKRDVNGILLLDKPGGLTSNRALQLAKRLFRAAKAGHTGSLDPLATGMLPVCFGTATRLSHFLLQADKRYTVVCELGAATDTGDADGTVTARAACPPLAEHTIGQVLARFEGEIEQIPPMYSALKHEGRRLYELARRGTEVERRPRTVRVHGLTLRAWRHPELELSVECSKGTYVRTLVADIAVAFGTLGHVVALRRESVEPFVGGRMWTLEELRALAEQGAGRALERTLLPPDAALRGWPKLVLEDPLASALRHGQSIPAAPGWPRCRVRLYTREEVFFGIGEVLESGILAPRRIFRR